MDGSQAVAARVWWSARRLRYNVGLVVAGVCAFALYVYAFEARCRNEPGAEITLFTTAFQAVGYGIAMGLANLCYQLGPALERLVPAGHVDCYRRIAYVGGFVLSVALPFSIPAAVAVWGCVA